MGPIEGLEITFVTVTEAENAVLTVIEVWERGSLERPQAEA